MRRSDRTSDVSRRDFLRGAAALLGAGSAAACDKAKTAEFVCTNTEGLAETDVAARAATAYTDRAPDPARSCDNCAQFLPAAEGCGTCKLLRGPIHPKGTCKIFSVKS